MKFIKKIAFGTMTSAFCIFGSCFESKADRIQISVHGGGQVFGNNQDIFGKKPASSDSTSSGDTDAEKKEEKFGMLDTLGLSVGGEFAYLYDFEYVGIGAGVGVNYFSSSVDVQKGTTKDKGTSSISIVQIPVGLKIYIYALGDQSLIIGFTPHVKFNVMGTFSNKAVENKDDKTLDDKKGRAHPDTIQSNTNDRMKTFQAGLDMMIAWDFREQIDCPIALGLDLNLTFMPLFDTEAPKKEDIEKDEKNKKYILGYELTDDKDNKKESPSFFASLGLKLIFDLGYYIFD